MKLFNFRFANAMRYYEKAYYLNLGKFGMSKPQTEYFKSKINSLKGFENQSKCNTLTTISHDRTSFANTIKTENLLQNEVIADVEGEAGQFNYRAKFTHIYEPFMLIIIANSREFSVYFDKSELIKFYNLRGNNSNKQLYSSQTISK